MTVVALDGAQLVPALALWCMQAVLSHLDGFGRRDQGLYCSTCSAGTISLEPVCLGSTGPVRTLFLPDFAKCCVH